MHDYLNIAHFYETHNFIMLLLLSVAKQNIVFQHSCSQKRVKEWALEHTTLFQENQLQMYTQSA